MCCNFIIKIILKIFFRNFRFNEFIFFFFKNYIISIYYFCLCLFVDIFLVCMFDIGFCGFCLLNICLFWFDI